MQGALNASPVVIPKAADTGGDIINIILVYFLRVENHFPVGETGFRRAAEVQDDFQ
jgi:hypothetical protein